MAATNDAEFGVAWLRLQCTLIDENSRGIVFSMVAGSDRLLPLAGWPDSFEVPAAAHSLVQRAVTERRGVALIHRPDTPAAAAHASLLHLAYPVVQDATVRVVVFLEMPATDTTQIEPHMRTLQWGSAWLAQRFSSPVATPATTTTGQDLLGVLTLALAERSPEAAALAVVNELATQLDCDRVSLGFLQNKEVRIVAMSHSGDTPQRLHLHRELQQMMEEAIDQQRVLRMPPDPSEEDSVLHAHREFIHHYGSASLLTVPFLWHDRSAGALHLERPSTQPFDNETPNFCQQVAGIGGPILLEKLHSGRPLHQLFWHRCLHRLKAFSGRKRWVPRIAACLLGLLVLFFSLATGEYRIAAPMNLEGTIQRVVIAPFNGFLYEALPRAGDVVHKGQILARLDSRELLLERLKWNSQKKQRLLEYNRAIAENNTAASQIIHEQINQAETQTALLDEQIARATIRAPFEGIIVRGDLSQTIGVPLERGQVLFEIAPLNSYRVMLDIDEKDIEEIQPGQQGVLVAKALPEQRFSFSITQVTPVSTIREGRNVFRVEGTLSNISDNLRPGMGGYAKVTIEDRKLLWIWSHELVDMIRLWLWAHLP